MQIDVSFTTFKALTALREHENDSLDDVIVRLLGSPTSAPLGVDFGPPASGLFMGEVLFPNGTRFRGRYKGAVHYAAVVDGVWTDQDGTQRNSPSEAAAAITNTNVNGWRFWEVKFPEREEWQLLDRLRGA
jgi:hypothetical protein